MRRSSIRLCVGVQQCLASGMTIFNIFLKGLFLLLKKFLDMCSWSDDIMQFDYAHDILKNSED